MKIPERDSKPFLLLLMTSKLKFLIVILLTIQTRTILMKPSSFLRSPSYVDFFGGSQSLFNEHEEDSLQKKANSIQLEGLKLNFKSKSVRLILFTYIYTSSYLFSRYSLWLFQLSQDERRKVESVLQISKPPSCFQIVGLSFWI